MVKRCVRHHRAGGCQRRRRRRLATDSDPAPALCRSTHPRFQFIILNRLSTGTRHEAGTGCGTAAVRSLRLCVLTDAPPPSLLSPENLVQDVLDNFECEMSPPYLLYRSGNEARPRPPGAGL